MCQFPWINWAILISVICLHDWLLIPLFNSLVVAHTYIFNLTTVYHQILYYVTYSLITLQLYNSNSFLLFFVLLLSYMLFLHVRNPTVLLLIILILYTVPFVKEFITLNKKFMLKAEGTIWHTESGSFAVFSFF